MQVSLYHPVYCFDQLVRNELAKQNNSPILLITSFLFMIPHGPIGLLYSENPLF